MKYIVLTGSCGGMGLATVKKLVANGYYVFGLDINENKEEINNFRYIKTDLRNLDSLSNAFNEIKKVTKEIDAIISMAGIYDLNSLIEMSEEDFIRIFDINVFAIYRVNKAFTPLLKEKGKVIIVSSELAPLDPLPFTGIYGITKSTIEKYAYSLRMELQLLNKQVVVIRPGAVDTSLLDVSTIKMNKFTESTELYKYNATRFQDVVNKVEAKKISVDKIADLTFKILNKKNPKYVYKINRNKGLLLLNILPKRLQNYIIKRILLDR